MIQSWHGLHLIERIVASSPYRRGTSLPVDVTGHLWKCKCAIYVNPATRETKLLFVQMSMTAVALLVVPLRLICRFLLLKSPGWDNISMVFAMVSNLMVMYPNFRFRTRLLGSVFLPSSPGAQRAVCLTALRCDALIGHSTECSLVTFAKVCKTLYRLYTK